MMLDRIIALLEREIASVEHSLLNGGCPDYTSYRELVAMAKTFRVAIEVAKKAFAEDEDEGET